MHKALIAGLSWAVVSLGACAAAAQTTSDPCFNPAASVNDRLADCTKWIESGRLSGDMLASAYRGRAYAKAYFSDFDAAFADLDQYMRLAPSNTDGALLRALFVNARDGHPGFGVGPESTMHWVSVDPKDQHSVMYLTDSAYVDITSRLVHVEICGIDSCRDPGAVNVYRDGTDAVLDCAKKTVTSVAQDGSESTVVDTVVTPGKAASAFRSQMARGGAVVVPGGRRQDKVASTSDMGRLFAKFCAKTAPLPRRLAPGSAHAGFSISAVDAGPAAGPRAGDEQLPASPSHAGKKGADLLWIHSEPIANRDMLVDARASVDANGRSIITLTLTQAGAQRMADITQYAGGEGNRLAIVVDGKVLASAVVQAPITDGHFVITGFTREQAASLARNFAVWTYHTSPTD
jgi:hypothetical protein